MVETAPTPAMIEAVRLVAEAGAAEALGFFRGCLPVANKTTDSVARRQKDGSSPRCTFDPVTEADRSAERVMRQRIGAQFPTHGILGEEFGEVAKPSPWRWVLDPVDGTRGFVSGTPTWTTLVGLEFEERPVVGAIVQPFTKEVWHGYPGETRYRRGDVEILCSVSGRTRLSEARLATTDPRPQPEGPMSDEESQLFLEVGRKCPVARFGLDAYAYGLLALGELDLVIEAGLQRYDVSALIPVLEGARARVSDWNGQSVPTAGGRMLVASSAALQSEAAALLRPTQI